MAVDRPTPRSGLAGRIVDKRIAELEREVANLRNVNNQRSVDTACATIDGLAVMLQAAARGDAAGYAMLTNLERTLNQARLLPPPVTPPNGAVKETT